MLNEKDIDTLMLKIRGFNCNFFINDDINFDINIKPEPAYVYYIAHNVELREGIIDEISYKSNADFRVLKLRVTNITNALFEYKKYLNNPSLYHTESEETYPDATTKYLYYYTVPNNNDAQDENGKFTKDFNSRMPSAIYGMKRVHYRAGRPIGEYNDPSPVKEIYTNVLKFCEYNPSISLKAYDNHVLDWKYSKLVNPVITDGIAYNYVTSDWYILDIENFPRTEKPLINVNQKTVYFMTNEEAQACVQQLRA